jgi:cobalt-zinc-cadmium efflux system protein
VNPHSHAHHDHTHEHEPQRDERRLAWTLLLTISFMAVEVIGGWLAGSLALIADAGHMLTDAASIALAWFALRLARLPSDGRRSYGYQRLTVLAAFVNGIVLIGAVIWIAVEAFGRLTEPHSVNGRLMLVIAAGGAVVNLIGMFVLRGHSHDNLTMRSAYLHVLSDLLGSVAAIAAAVVILATGWVRIDPLLSLLVAVLIVRSAVALVRESGHILMEGAPEGFDVDKLRVALRGCVPGLIDVHHVHAWSLTSRETLLTLHARVDERANASQALAEIKICLAQQFGIQHSTVQIEAERCADSSDPCK